MTGHIDPTRETFATFRTSDRPGPIHMLSLVRFREKTAYPDGRDATGAYGRDSQPVFSRLEGKIVRAATFRIKPVTKATMSAFKPVSSGMDP